MSLTRDQARILLGSIIKDFADYVDLEPTDAGELQIRLEDFMMTRDTDAALRAELARLRQHNADLEQQWHAAATHEASSEVEAELRRRHTVLTHERDAAERQEHAAMLKLEKLEAQLAAMTQERNEAETRNENYRLKLNEHDRQLAAIEARVKSLGEALANAVKPRMGRIDAGYPAIVLIDDFGNPLL